MWEYIHNPGDFVSHKVEQTKQTGTLEAFLLKKSRVKSKALGENFFGTYSKERRNKVNKEDKEK
jgi:hypothetical protein